MSSLSCASAGSTSLGVGGSAVWVMDGCSSSLGGSAVSPGLGGVSSVVWAIDGAWSPSGLGVGPWWEAWSWLDVGV